MPSIKKFAAVGDGLVEGVVVLTDARGETVQCCGRKVEFVAKSFCGRQSYRFGPEITENKVRPRPIAW
jgi:hypothetical protein